MKYLLLIVIFCSCNVYAAPDLVAPNISKAGDEKQQQLDIVTHPHYLPAANKNYRIVMYGPIEWSYLRKAMSIDSNGDIRTELMKIEQSKTHIGSIKHFIESSSGVKIPNDGFIVYAIDISCVIAAVPPETQDMIETLCCAVAGK